MRKGGIAPGVIAPAELWQLQLRLVVAGLANLGASSFTLQQQELLADRHGIEYAARAGYDPAAAVRFLEELARREDVAPLVEFIKAHPPAAERVQRARKIVGEMQSRSSSLPDRHRFARQATPNPAMEPTGAGVAARGESLNAVGSSPSRSSRLFRSLEV